MCLDMLYPPALHTEYTLRNHERNLQMSHSLWKPQLRGGQLINWNRCSWAGGVETTGAGSSCSAKKARRVEVGGFRANWSKFSYHTLKRSWLVKEPNTLKIMLKRLEFVFITCFGVKHFLFFLLLPFFFFCYPLTTAQSIICFQSFCSMSEKVNALWHGMSCSVHQGKHHQQCWA